MACEDFQVKIVGDISDVQKLVDSALNAAAEAASSAKEAKTQASLAAGYAFDAENSPPKLRTSYNGLLMSPRTSAYDFHGDGVEVVHTDPTAYTVLVKGFKNNINIDDIPGLKAELATLARGKIDNVSSLIDAPKKLITLSLMSGTHVVGSDVIDISAMFHQGKVVQYAIYFGFCLSKAPNEQAIKANDTKMVTTIKGLDISISRSDQLEKYQYIWIPDYFPQVAGFKFGGQFIDKWQHVSSSINGVSGKLYVSDNPTHARVVTWEVVT